MSRRIDTYARGYGFEFWNLIATVGSLLIAAATALFIWNVIKSRREARHLPPPGPDPWDARSLEWSVPSPVPVHNFDTVPQIRSRDDWWHTKYGEGADGSVVRLATAEEAAQTGEAQDVHLPSPSFWPLAVAVGLPLIGYGLIFNLWFALIGALIAVGSLYSWALEPVDDPDAVHDHHDDHTGHDDSSGPPPPPPESPETPPPAPAEAAS